MAPTGALAARCLTILLTLVVLRGHPGLALGLKTVQSARAAAVNPASYEELTTSLLANQLAVLQLLQDGSNAGSDTAKREAQLEEEAAERDASLQEMKKAIESLQEDQKGLRAMVQTATQEKLTGVASLRKEMTTKVTSLEQELASKVTFLREEISSLGRLIKEYHRDACPDGWLHHESSCYLVDGTNHTWGASVKYCKGHGGNLAKITSAEEQEFIREHLGTHTWIGLNDRATDGTFVWTDGSAPTYTAWADEEPDGRDTYDCVYMRGDSYNYKWSDYQCNYTINAACEKAAHV